MTIDERIKAFASLGSSLRNMSDSDLQTLAERARNNNPWFTPVAVRKSILGIYEMLTEEALRSWTARYNFTLESKRIGLVLAGNIPMVGFHDLLCVLIAGHSVLVKLSSKDQVLIDDLIGKLVAIEPRFKDRIETAEQLKSFDAIIATGSDNTSRYFEYYFARYPHIIRRNRTSVAILDGTESDEELRALAEDVFTYFGLGCRNVSKLFVPQGFSFDRLFENWESFADIIHHHKYCNNYDYQKSILLVNGDPFLDNGFVMLQESVRTVSPISVVYFEYVNNETDLAARLEELQDKIQVVVGRSTYAKVAFGQAQFPSLSDYADNIDTMKFLSTL